MSKHGQNIPIPVRHKVLRNELSPYNVLSGIVYVRQVAFTSWATQQTKHPLDQQKVLS
jgi:hypothetical protein